MVVEEVDGGPFRMAISAPMDKSSRKSLLGGNLVDPFWPWLGLGGGKSMAVSRYRGNSVVKGSLRRP